MCTLALFIVYHIRLYFLLDGSWSETVTCSVLESIASVICNVDTVLRYEVILVVGCIYSRTQNSRTRITLFLLKERVGKAES